MIGTTRTAMSRTGMLAIRPLRRGETDIVESVFGRLGPRSRTLRFGGAKALLAASELEALADVGERRHAVVAFVAGDWAPAGIARFVVDADDRSIADVAIAVVDEHQGRGIGKALMRALVADARAAGVERVRATIAGENRRSLALLRGVTTFEDVRFDAGSIEVLAAIPCPAGLLRAA
jgi:ribosomal protein S18 acetylase RimI-like enzyme